MHLILPTDQLQQETKPRIISKKRRQSILAEPVEDVLADLTDLAREKRTSWYACMSLARSLQHDREALLRLLLELCKNRTFNRIVRCPTYPTKIVTQDLEDRRHLFWESIASDPYEISYALAILYEAATKKDLRKKLGQYFTPAHVARRAMFRIGLTGGETVLDPGCGTGIFPLTILRELTKKSERPASFRYWGIENDPLLALSAAISLDWVDAPSNWQVLYANYLNIQSEDIEKILERNPGKLGKIGAIICNPPFVRYHKLGERSKLASKLDLEPTSGLHSFFLAHSSELVTQCRMIFVIPLEMNGTRYGTTQLEYLGSKFTLDSEVTYYDESSRVWNSIASHKIPLETHTKMKLTWNLVLFSPILEAKKESQVTAKVASMRKATVLLNSFASGDRGISTGANHFFCTN